jgi:hypothetical protein
VDNLVRDYFNSHDPMSGSVKDGKWKWDGKTYQWPITDGMCPVPSPETATEIPYCRSYQAVTKTLMNTMQPLFEQVWVEMDCKTRQFIPDKQEDPFKESIPDFDELYNIIKDDGKFFLEDTTNPWVR